METTTQQHKDLLKTTNTDQFSVDYRRIQIEPDFNFRQSSNYGDMEGLALSVTQFGVIEAVLGYRKNGEFIMTEGHRRKLAVEMAHEYHKRGKPGFEDISKIQRIPFKVSSANRLDRLLVMGITGQGKQPLTDLEKANLYSSLIEEYANIEVKRTDAIREITRNLGISQASFYNIVALNKLPEAIKEHISSKEITGNTVTHIVREIKDPQEQILAVKQAIKDSAELAEKHGKKQRKATVRNVKGLQPKSIREKLQAIKEIIEKAQTENVRAKAFLSLIEGLEGKTSIKKLAELFL